MARAQMKLRNKVVLLLLLVVGLVGCAPIPSFMMKNSVTFVFHDNFGKQQVVFKNTWPKCANFNIAKTTKYNLISDDCKVTPEGHVPSEIVIEYAPWLTLAQQNEIPDLAAKETFLYKKVIAPDTGNLVDEVIGRDEAALEYNGTVRMRNVQSAIDKLPASSWKRIVLHPTDLVSKYRFNKPSGRGNRLRGKELHYIITLNPDGSYKVEDKLYWVSPYSKYGQ